MILSIISILCGIFIILISTYAVFGIGITCYVAALLLGVFQIIVGFLPTHKHQGEE